MAGLGVSVPKIPAPNTSAQSVPANVPPAPSARVTTYTPAAARSRAHNTQKPRSDAATMRSCERVGIIADSLELPASPYQRRYARGHADFRLLRAHAAGGRWMLYFAAAST